MTDDDADRAARAAARRDWPGTLGRVTALPEVELVDGDPAELLALVTELSLRAWRLSGRPLPDYSREDIPGRLVRRSRAS